MDYLEQILLVVRAEAELGISRFQIRRPNHSATLPPSICGQNNLKTGSRRDRKANHRKSCGTCAEKKTDEIAVKLSNNASGITNLFRIVFKQGERRRLMLKGLLQKRRRCLKAQLTSPALLIPLEVSQRRPCLYLQTNVRTCY